MNKYYKYLIYLGGAVVLFAAIYLVIRGLQGNSASPGSGNAENGQNSGAASSSLPSYILDPGEEQKVYEFVKNFTELYNTYSYADFSNLTALGDYQTPEMQQTTIKYVSFLEKNTAPGYFQEAGAIKDSFRYDYPNASNLTANLVLRVKKYSNFYPKIGNEISLRESYSTKLEGENMIAVQLGLIKVGSGWQVNSFQIK